MSRLAGVVLAGLVLAVLPAPVAAAGVPERCPGAAIEPDRVITGSFHSSLQGSYVLLPFDVPEGTTAVRVKYCWDGSDSPLASIAGDTLDLALYEARPGPGRLWGKDEFRGSSGSAIRDVTVSPEGFSSEEEYLADRKGRVPGKTTRGYEPGPIPAGEWAVELGVAGVVPASYGDSDGVVHWRVEIELGDDPAYADEPYEPAPYDTRPARSEPGWYAGDFHVHADHEPGNAPMREVFDYAFRPLSEGGAGLDFIWLSEHNTDSHWGEIGRHQARYPGKLIGRSAEVTTYRGHLNNHGSATFVDYRTGPVYERNPDGSLTLLRPARPASAVFDDIHAAGGFTQVNHPAIFPSFVPLFELFCRGCSWDYSGAETDWRKVDAIEIATGPGGLNDPLKIGPNPFTLLALFRYQAALASGPDVRIAAVGSSDSHHAGVATNPITQAPIGQATTVVYADELSEDGIRRGVEAGHTYVKLYGNDGPDLRFEAREQGSGGPPAIMGDTLRTRKPVEFKARVIGAAPLSGRDPRKPDPYELIVTWNGLPLLAVPILSDDVTIPFTLPVPLPGRWALQLHRGTTIEAVTTPIHVVG